MRLALSAVLLAAMPAHALSGVAREFMQIAAQLEPVLCEKRKLRREIAIADEEKKDARELLRRFESLERDPKNLRLERRLADLQPLLARSSDPEDLEAIDRHRRQAFYRCE
jgi:hypothetical protein